MLRETYKPDDARCQEILAKYIAKIEEFVRYRIGNREDQEDVIAEIRVGVCDSFKKGLFEADRGTSEANYVLGICRNKLKTYYTLRKRNQHIRPSGDDINYFPDPDIPPEELADDREYVKRLVDSLEPKYREVLFLRYYQGKTIPEISRLLNLPTRRVSERINYAIQKLKKKLKR